MSPARDLIEWCRAFVDAPPPSAVLDRARWCLLDALGCGLFGAGQPWARIVADEASADGTGGSCTVLGRAGTLSAPLAALANGTAIHGFELDDLLPAAIIHPGTVIVPAVLAAAEAVDAPGRELLGALVAGYECTARISLALGEEPSHRGFHKTAVVGPVASAIAAGVAMRLPVDAIVCAAGLACSASSGIKAFAAGEGGGMVKRLHAGRAAEAGVRMAQLARRGFTGPPSAIDGRFGLLEVYAGASAAPSRLTDGLGAAWAMDGVWTKVYPVCGWIQGVVQLLGRLRGDAALAPGAVRAVRVGTSAFAVKFNGNRRPADTMEAQYSIPYCAAVALTGDPAHPGAYAPAALARDDWQALADRVVLEVDPESDAVYPHRFGCRVRLELASGEVREAATLDAHGTPADPCSAEEQRARFLRLAALAPHPCDGEAITAAVERLDATPSTRALTRLLRPGG